MNYITNKNNIFYPDAIEAAIIHAKEMFPEESCGAIIDDEYVRFENKADDPNDPDIKQKEFLIMDEQYADAYRNDYVQAVIHSHNNHPKASIFDQERQIEAVVPFGIINLVNRSCTHVAFWGDSLPVEPLKKRSFFYGVWDCFGLARDYFRIKHGIVSKNIPRDYGFWLRGESVFEKFMSEFDIVEIPKKEIRPNDVLFYNLHGTKYLNHCGVMQDNGLVLHHFENHVSQDAPISFQQQFLRSAGRLRWLS
jgi:proteasome lid subunit RPN8/RPN11